MPSRTDVPEVVEPSKVYDYDKLAGARGMYELTYQHITGRIHSTRLRIVYRDELIRLKSPFCKAFDRDPESLEQQLMDRIYWPENPANTSATLWMAKYLGETIFDGSDDDTGSDDNADSDVDTEQGNETQPGKSG